MLIALPPELGEVCIIYLGEFIGADCAGMLNGLRGPAPTTIEHFLDSRDPRLFAPSLHSEPCKLLDEGRPNGHGRLRPPPFRSARCVLLLPLSAP